MQDAIKAPQALAILVRLSGLAQLEPLWPVVLKIAVLHRQFGKKELTPHRMVVFERSLNRFLRAIGRMIMEFRLNCLE